MTNVNDDIRKAVRIEMARRDWNQSELAEVTGLSRQYISELMSGKAGNLTEAWEKIFGALKITLKAEVEGK
jgi:transcriptional regulator with XRE-family HTH domain